MRSRLARLCASTPARRIAWGSLLLVPVLAFAAHLDGSRVVVGAAAGLAIGASFVLPFHAALALFRRFGIAVDRGELRALGVALVFGFGVRAVWNAIGLADGSSLVPALLAAAVAGATLRVDGRAEGVASSLAEGDG